MSTAQCPSDYVPFDDNCYKFVNTPRSFDDAVNDCSSDGGSLIQVSESGIQDFLAQQMNDEGWEETWIGGREQVTDWRWVAGQWRHLLATLE